jgi:predicted HNH restriction endonuclease
MRIGKQIDPVEINRAQASPTESNVHELARASAALHEHENGNDETSANNLGTLLRQVSESSTREIENLINELHGLRKKLNADGDRIQSDIEIHAELSEAVVRLTTIISENVKSISDTAKRRVPVRGQ